MTSYTVTATNSDGSAGIYLQAEVITGATEAGGASAQLDNGNLTGTVSLTPNFSGSFIAWAADDAISGPTGITPAANNKLLTVAANGDSAVDSNGFTACAGYYSGTVTAATPVTVGYSGSLGSSNGELAAYEVHGASWAEDASTPAWAHTSAAATITTASFTPPVGAVLVAVVTCNFNTTGSGDDITVSSTPALTWTRRAANDANAFLNNGGVAVWTATVPPGVSLQDVPQVSPGPFWLQLFKHQLPKPFRLPYSFAGVSSSGSFVLAPLHFAAAGNQTSPDAPQINPGPLWLSRFKQWQWKPRPVPPAVQGIGSTGSFALAPLAFAARGSQSSPDIPRFDPGVFWLQLFKPQLPKPWRITPDAGAPVTLVTATGNLVLAPLAFTANGSQTSPDQPQVNPGTTWLRLFRPDLYKPVPVPPAQGSVNGTGSFSFASVVFQGQGSQTSPDVLQVSPGTTWIRLFRPDLHKPVPVPPAFQAVSGTASFSLASLHFSATGNQTSPDVPQVQPGTTWLDLFKPWLPKPRPVPPALQSVNGTTAAQTGFALASLKFAASGTVSAAAPPDVPQIAPGPSWLSRFKPWVPKRPRPDAQQFISAVTESGPFNIWLPGGCVHFGTPKIVIPALHVTLQGFVGNYGSFNITIPSLKTSLTGVHYGSRLDIVLPSPVTSLAAKIEGGAFNPVLPPLKAALSGTTTHVHSGPLSISLGQCFSIGGHFFRMRAAIQLPPEEPADYLLGSAKVNWKTQLPVKAWSVSNVSVTISHLSTEYVLVPVTASKNGSPYNPGADPVQFAFMPTPTQVPITADWVSGSWQTEATNILYPYAARVLVGPAGASTLGIGTYQIYVKISDSPEVPVKQAGQLVIT